MEETPASLVFPALLFVASILLIVTLIAKVGQQAEIDALREQLAMCQAEHLDVVP